jgi:hypothetical protein
MEPDAGHSITNVLQFRHVRPAGPTTYDRIPYSRLRIERVDWWHRENHIRRRSARKGRPTEVDVEPEWATEAAMDQYRLVGDSGSRSGLSVRVIGRSPSAGRVLTLVLVPKHRPPAGEWWGATAWAANERERRAYRAAMERSAGR